MLLDNTIKRIHFIGIGGAGMSGIAEILIGRGYAVSGSDVVENAATRQLQIMGADVLRGHAAANVEGASIVVYSSAISPNNPELVAAQQAHIPILQRAQMLSELMQSQLGIAVAGTHGKTTTTGLISTILIEADLDPTFVIGGLLVSSGVNARIGSSEYFIAEADESDKSFLYLSPKIIVVTNIDVDHLNNYGDFANLKQTFLHFIERLPADGLAILCSDDPVICELLPQIKRRVITYGFQETDAIHALNYSQQGTRCQITVARQFKADLLEVTLNLPGRHNVLNALAAIAVATHCGIADDAIIRALLRYQGTGRRFQIFGEIALADGQALLIDDYGHHPREIAATIEAIRKAWPERRLVVAFQPHRYTRTQTVFSDFVQALVLPDVLLLLDIYSAGEVPIPGVSGKILFDAVYQQQKSQVFFIEKINELPEKIRQVLKAGDILLTQGAGDIGKVAPQLLQMKL